MEISDPQVVYKGPRGERGRKQHTKKEATDIQRPYIKTGFNSLVKSIKQNKNSFYMIKTSATLFQFIHVR